jgi:hemoglobin
VTATIYERIGGHAAVATVVEEFYRRVLGDPALAPYFVGVDVERLKAHQRAFVAAALGGPGRYDGRTMAAAHSHLGVTGDAFDGVVNHLAGALADAGVDQATIQEIAGALLPLRAQIVTGHP